MLDGAGAGKEAEAVAGEVNDWARRPSTRQKDAVKQKRLRLHEVRGWMLALSGQTGLCVLKTRRGPAPMAVGTGGFYWVFWGGYRWRRGGRGVVIYLRNEQRLFRS